MSNPVLNGNEIIFNFNLIFHCLSARPATRRKGASVSYKEDSADETDSEDLVEVDWGQEAIAAATETENAETIERIIDTRYGRKGGLFLYSFNISFRLMKLE